MQSVINLSARRPHECVFCQASFQRPDALKRHWKTCKPRIQQSLEIPQVSSKAKGRKPKACERCSRLKKGCVPTAPGQSCQSCISINSACLYKRRNCHRSLVDLQEKRIGTGTCLNPAPVQMDLQYRSTFHLNTTSQRTIHGLFQEYSLGTSQIRRPSEMDLSILSSFPYLGNIVTTSGIANAFECGTSQYRLFIRQKMPFYQVKDFDESQSFFSGPLSLTENNNLNGADEQLILPWQRLGIQFPLASPSLLLSDQDATTLNRSCEIIDKIRNAIVSKATTSKILISWSDPIEAMCLQFFSPTSIERYLTLFWFAWYPNCPFIHRTSFDSTTSHLNLVIAMVVIGACISPVESDRAMANVWFNVVEEMIFSDEAYFRNPMSRSQRKTTMSDLSDRLSTLQAGYCVCLYQTWEGSRDNKLRIRRHRYNAIIGLARDMGLRNAALDTVSTEDMASFDWQEFIFRESLIRLFSWIFNLDIAYGIFHQQPPRMVIQEADIDLSSPEVCFQAETDEECFIALKLWRSNMAPRKNLTISFALRAICSETPQYYGNVFSNMGVVSMFTIISALYSLTYEARNSTSMIDTTSIRRGLDHWRLLWPSQARDMELAESFSNSDPNRWKTLGFMRHAPEYWLLTSLLLDQTQGGQSTHPSHYLFLQDDTDMIQFNRLITKLRSQQLPSVS